MGGPEIERLIALLSKLPGLGPRSARRATLKLLQQPELRMLPLATALADAARATRSCELCGNLDSRDPCTVCADPHRDRATICVVENVGDLWALERAHVHRGLYHVLGGTLSALAGQGPEDLSLRPLMARLEAGGALDILDDGTLAAALRARR
jgi:recombination protein RecR